MATGKDIFLQMEGISGDSKDATYKGWIEIEGYQYDMSQPSGGARGAQGSLSTGRVSYSEFRIIKRVDLATPVIANYCAQAKSIPNIELVVCRAMGEKTPYMHFKFQKSIIAGVKGWLGADPEDQGGEAEVAKVGDVVPYEQISLRASVMEWQFSATETDDSMGGDTNFIWDILGNAPA